VLSFAVHIRPLNSHHFGETQSIFVNCQGPLSYNKPHSEKDKGYS